MKLTPYISLIRLDKPIGIWLLFWPTAWGLWLANPKPSLLLVFKFFLGTFLMRSAGCVINDIADRHVDKYVKRTANRPLTTGDISLQGAFLCLILCLILSFVILLTLPEACFYDALIAVCITFIYPFCKRYIAAPQLILGIAFSMGIPMAYHAQYQILDSQFYMLFLLNFIWTVCYDTEYAMVDREDDLRLNLRSTAILFGRWEKTIIALGFFYIQLLWLWLAKNLISPIFLFAYLASSAILIYQLFLIKDRTPLRCFNAFKLNGLYGFLMWTSLM